MGITEPSALVLPANTFAVPICSHVIPKHAKCANNVCNISNNTNWSKLSIVPPPASSSSMATSSLALATNFVYRSSNAFSSHIRIGGIVASPYN